MAQLAHDVASGGSQPPVSSRDDIVVLRGATWADYQRLLEIRGDRSVPRLTYLEGTLELMTPSRTHDFTKSSIGRLLEAWCFVKAVEFTPYGSWTLENKEAERGVEPDECYCLGENAALDEPVRPDLAIEVIHTSGSVSKLEVYRRLHVQEVWIWQKGKLTTHALRGEKYETISRSELLSELDLEHLLQFADIRPVSRAVREYQAALRGPR